MGAYRVCHDGASERAFRIEDERNMYLHTFAFVRLFRIIIIIRVDIQELQQSINLRN